MKVQAHQDVAGFFEQTRAALESNEPANSLMLGVGGQIERQPERFLARPCLKTVVDGGDLVLAAMMTPPHKLLVYGHRGDLQHSARLLAEHLVQEGVHLPGVTGPSRMARLVAHAWAAATGVRPEIERRQRVFELREVLVPRPARGRLRTATASDLDLVARWWAGFQAEVFGHADRDEARRAAEVRIGDGTAYLWDDLWPVAMAVTTRPTRHGVSVGGVYTPPEQRNKGYATACVGELSRLLLDSGWMYCSLFCRCQERRGEQGL